LILAKTQNSDNHRVLPGMAKITPPGAWRQIIALLTREPKVSKDKA